MCVVIICLQGTASAAMPTRTSRYSRHWLLACEMRLHVEVHLVVCLRLLHHHHRRRRRRLHHHPPPHRHRRLIW